MSQTIALPVYECKKCEHRWIPRKERTPKMCPVCKRRNWNEGKGIPDKITIR